MAKVQPITLKNATIWNGKSHEIRDLHFAERMLDAPADDALTIDLEGYTVFPGMVNAHDHLELNHYPRTKFRDIYDNAHQWGEDVNAQLDSEPYKTLRAYPLWDRCFIGGLKNLLCGALTVAQHGPPHKPLFRKDFPVHVLKQYGWAHSLHFNTEAEIIASYNKIPHNIPWFIHLAEGTDDVAKSEYKRLKALGLEFFNKTVLIHATAILLSEDIPTDDVRGIVWCPSTNAYLLGKDAVPKMTEIKFFKTNAFALGSDSRLTANGDLLDELNFAFQTNTQLTEHPTILWQMVFDEGRFILSHERNHDWFTKEFFADFFLLRTQDNDAVNLFTSSRKDLHLIVKGGIPQIGDPELMAKFTHVETVPAVLDGVPKAVNINLAHQINKCKLNEHGLNVENIPPKRFWSFG